MTNLSVGDVIFVRGNSLLSKVIRYFDEGEFSHVAIVLDENHCICSQYPNGVRIRHFRFKDYEVVKVPIDIEKVRRYIGYNYDFKQFFWYAFRKGRMWDTPDKFICSELVAYSMGKDEWIGLTPNELYQKISEG